QSSGGSGSRGDDDRVGVGVARVSIGNGKAGGVIADRTAALVPLIAQGIGADRRHGQNIGAAAFNIAASGLDGNSGVGRVGMDVKAGQADHVGRGGGGDGGVIAQSRDANQPGFAAGNIGGKSLS